MDSIEKEATPSGAVRDESIRRLVEPAPVFDPSDHGRVVHAFFKEHPSAEGAVAVRDGQPLGLIMRNDFYQKLGSQYGRDLFMRRPIALIMNDRPLVVDVSVDIATIAMIAMNREQDRIYDMVVVTERDAYLGVVGVKRFMIELSRQRGVEIELLTRQREILRRANEAEVAHRQEMEAKNAVLAEKNASIRNLLDNAGQGFLSFGPDLVVSEEYSRECVRLFRGPVGGRPLLDLLGRNVTAETAQTFVSVLGNVFAEDQGLRRKVYLSLLPGEIQLYDRIVRVEYTVIHNGPDRRMMLVLTDVTDKKRLERRMAEERDNVALVVRALSRQAEVNMALDDARRFFGREAGLVVAEAESAAAALFEIFRLVHTFKGDFAQLGFHRTAAGLHVIEDGLSALTADPSALTRDDLAALVAGWDAEALLAEDLAVLTANLGQDFFSREERFLLRRERLLELEARVAALVPEPARREVLVLLGALRRHNLKDLVRGYEDYLAALAERLDKAIEPLRVTGDDVLVTREAVAGFVKSLSHVLRNMLDHGIEPVEERLAAGKPELGRIKCRIRDLGEAGVSLSVSDDGRGVDVKKVLAKAVDMGLVTKDAALTLAPAEIYGLLFLDAFSTREGVSAVSGRGVGLAAVRAEVEGLGGTVRVRSEEGQGTKFVFTLPRRVIEA